MLVVPSCSQAPAQNQGTSCNPADDKNEKVFSLKYIKILKFISKDTVIGEMTKVNGL